MGRIALLGGLTVALVLGCNGGGGSSHGSAKTAAAATAGPAMSPLVTTAAPAIPVTLPAGTFRPDIFTGTALPAASLQAGPRTYGWPSVEGVTFGVYIDTLPSGQMVDVTIQETFQRGKSVQNTLVRKSVKTPFSPTVTATMDSYMTLTVTDPNAVNLVVREVRVKPAKQLDASSFSVIFHLAGDSFAGFNEWNDLKTDADVAAFFTDLAKRVNLYFKQAGIQIDMSRSGYDKISTAAVAQKAPGLVANGKTYLKTQTAKATEWGQFALPATDTSYGKALDIFIVQGGSLVDGRTLGICECYVPMGGIFEGGGPGSFLVAAIFPEGSEAVTLDDLANTVAHEIGHFLSLSHPTEENFVVDDLVDTPVAVEGASTRADGTNVMCAVSGPGQNVFTPDQINAMKGFLATRPH